MILNNNTEKGYKIMSDTITISVDGMNCGHCSGMVQKTLEEIDGIENIQVSLEEKNASFSVSNPDLVQIAISKVTDAGYKASAI